MPQDTKLKILMFRHARAVEYMDTWVASAKSFEEWLMQVDLDPGEYRAWKAEQPETKVSIFKRAQLRGLLPREEKGGD